MDALRRTLGELPLGETLEAKIFKKNGFEVVFLDRKDLVPIPGNPEVICMDDREPNVGIKLPGGVSFEAAYSTGGSEAGFGEAVYRDIFKRKRVPTAHGDEHHLEKGCAFNAAWSEGRLEKTLPLYVSLGDIGRVVGKSGGRYDMLSGGHNAHLLVLNMVGKMTTRPGLLAADCLVAREIAGNRYEGALNDLAQLVASPALNIHQVGIIR